MKYLYTFANGNHAVELDGFPCTINESEYPEAWAEVFAYLSEHPKALVPEPVPPPPSPKEVEAARIAGIKAKLAELDAQSARPMRAIAAGTATDDDRKRLAAIEAEAAGLRAQIGSANA